MQKTYGLTLTILALKLPRLHHHLLTTLGLTGPDLFEPMFRTLFACGLEIDLLSRVWDVFVFEGDRVCIRAAVAVLGGLEGRLYGGREEVLGALRGGAWEVGGEEAFLGGVRGAGKDDRKAATGTVVGKR